MPGTDLCIAYQMSFGNMVIGIWLDGEQRSNGQKGQHKHWLNFLTWGHSLILKWIHYQRHNISCMLMIWKNYINCRSEHGWSLLWTRAAPQKPSSRDCMLLGGKTLVLESWRCVVPGLNLSLTYKLNANTIFRGCFPLPVLRLINLK